MAGISAIHHALCDVDSAARNIPIRVNVGDAINRTGVQAHPQFQFRPAMQLLRQLDGAPYGCFGVCEKHQRHPIPSGQRNKLILALCSSEFRSAGGYLLERFHLFPLVVHRKLGVAHNVDEENVGNLQLRSGCFIAQEVCELTWNPSGREYEVFRFTRQFTPGAERCAARAVGLRPI